ncbi:S1C family serine protease [Pleomorphomonas sp. JP5]|uniref:S1C family serine protease n=1 Tax=Pleomorphomonas sp. JP5 TaxID=2942998 RepID=UPI0020444FE1|nr:serine protease [Pleomorphomonas sp. JP5]MCM5557551.1 serine protease [Pleomorphomonas sp. JP5]
MSVLSRNAWLVVFLVLSPGSASAMASEFYDNDITYYGNDNWTVAVNLARKSCYMSNLYEHRFRVLLGTDRSGGETSYDFLFIDTSWTYEAGKTYEVITKFGEHPAWASDGIGLSDYYSGGIAVEHVKAEAVEEFVAAPSFTLEIADRDYGSFSLGKARNAFAKMVECSQGIETGRISLVSVAKGYGADVPWRSPPTPPVVSSPDPTPKEDEGKRGDVLTGGAEDGSSFGNGKESIPASTALGEDYYASDRIYAKEGNWWVWVTRARKSCSMAATFAGDAEITVGGDHRGGKLAYFFLFSKASWDYEQGKDYEVTVEYDGHSTWAGDGVGVVHTGQNGVALEGVHAEAVDEFAAARTLGLKIGSREHGVFDISGSRAGIAKLRECMAAVDDGRISLEAGVLGGGPDFLSPPTPAPTPKEDEARPNDAPRGRGKGGPVPGKGKEPVVVSGSGFFVDKAGYLLTNAHVVEGCGTARLRFEGRTEPAIIVARERDHDLALLKMRGRSPAFATFRGGPSIRLGESVVVFGYPLSGYLSKSGNLSTGLVASLAGVEDNEAEMQISAPVQSGNSGGPVVDQSGHVVGVVVAKSNTTTVDDDYVEVIQNANFAIKADVAKAFLDDRGVAYETEAPGEELKTPDVADIARAFSAQVICELSE